MDSSPSSNALAAQQAALLVAHPDDETLWAGGFLLEHPHWQWFVGTLCRASDPDRAPKFQRLLQRLGVRGAMADMDDGPEQTPLAVQAVERQVLALLPQHPFDLMLTHGPRGEYTWHRRHVEAHQAIAALWRTGQIATKALWLFAYADSDRRLLPQAVPGAHHYHVLPPEIWQAKYDLITQLYGFQPESWEARTTPRAEAFWCFSSPRELDAWLSGSGVLT